MVHLASEGASDDICASGLRQDLFRWQGAARAPRRMLYFVTEAGNLMVASIRESAGRWPALHRECRPGHEYPASKCHHQLDRGAEEEMTCVTGSRPSAVWS